MRRVGLFSSSSILVQHSSFGFSDMDLTQSGHGYIYYEDRAASVKILDKFSTQSSILIYLRRDDLLTPGMPVTFPYVRTTGDSSGCDIYIY